MNKFSASAIAHPNIAFIKYWGNANDEWRLPSNGSISMNLAELHTTTNVIYRDNLEKDELIINGQSLKGSALERVIKFLDFIRESGKQKFFARVESENNFPLGAGIASSSSAFAALALAATHALGMKLTEVQLSRMARRGSGSACRSIPGGFVEWQTGTCDEDSFAISIAPSSHWKLVDCIAIVQEGQKKTGSSEGHKLAKTSPMQFARVEDAARRLDLCRSAIMTRDFEKLAEIVELDSNLLHAVMMTSSPPLFYWEPTSLFIMREIRQWREQGTPVCYTLDAGPNVHILTLPEEGDRIMQKLMEIPGVHRVLTAHVGDGARLVQ